MRIEISACRLCWKLGHDRRTCPQRGDRLRSIRRCAACGRTGHSRRRCSRPVVSGRFLVYGLRDASNRIRVVGRSSSGMLRPAARVKANKQPYRIVILERLASNKHLAEREAFWARQYGLDDK